jgi:hypothetical protein
MSRHQHTSQGPLLPGQVAILDALVSANGRPVRSDKLRRLVRPASTDNRRDGVGCTPGTLWVYMHGLRRKTGARITVVGVEYPNKAYLLEALP